MKYARKYVSARIPSVILAIVALACTQQARTQSALAPSRNTVFDVVSIKPATSCGRSNSDPIMINVCGTARSLINTAYVTFRDGQRHPWEVVPIEGGAAWSNSELYQITAKAENAPGSAWMAGPMLQALLEDRFKLKIHRETREVSVFSLTAAKGGPKLLPFKEGSCVTIDLTLPLQRLNPGQRSCGLAFATLEVQKGNVIRELHGVDLGEFATYLGASLGRPVINQTEIKGKFEIHLEYSEDERAPGTGQPATAAQDPKYSSIFSALQEQLGLKVESTKGPGQFLVVDYVERPKID